jgi:hypothetical protein
MHANSLGYRIKEGCLYASRAPQAPKNARQSKHQLAFDGRFSVIVGNYCSFEGFIILSVLECCNNRFGSEAMECPG